MINVIVTNISAGTSVIKRFHTMKQATDYITWVQSPKSFNGVWKQGYTAKIQ